MYSSWTIYSIGDAAFLEQIMISVAMVTGTGDFSRAAAIGLLFAVVIISFQAVFKGGQELNLHQAFASWLLFALMFWPTTTVVIEDGVTGDVRVVANVPYGVGAAGGMISGIGYGLTELFELGYSYISPGVTSTHFAESLNLLNDLRSAAASPLVVNAMNYAAGGDLRKSWDNYIRECTLVKIDLGVETVDGLLSTRLPDALRFDSELFGTRHYLSGSSGTNQSCAQTYDVLRTHTNQALYDLDFLKQLGQALGTENASIPSPLNSIQHVANAMDVLRLTQTTAYSFVEATILVPLYAQAVKGKYQDMQDFSSALMINQAIQQRNLQWASEQSMFMSVIRPVQTFFEGFVYALTPLIGVLVITGSFGVMLAFKYLQTLLWIQFWLPVLSIINLYINVSASGELSAFDSTDLTSIYYLAGASDVLQNWVSVGGMLAAATPVISLFLVTGSTYAMTNIAGKIGGADHVNERIASPDVVQPGAVMQSQPKFGFDTVKGTTLSGAEGMIENMSFGSMLSGNVASAKEKSEQAQQGFRRDLGRVIESAAQSNRMSEVGTRLGEVGTSTGTNQAQAVQNSAAQIGNDFNLTSQQQRAVTGAVALAAGGNVQAGANLLNRVLGKGGESGSKSSGTGVSAGVNFTNKNQTVDGTSVSAQDLQRYLNDAGWSEGDTAAYQNQLAYAIESSGKDTWSHAVGDKAAKSFVDSASDVVSTGRNYKEMTSLSQEFGTAGRASLDSVAGTLLNSNAPGAQQALNNMNEQFRLGVVGSKVQQNAVSKAAFYEGLGKDSATAQVMGRLAAMMNVNNYDDPSLATAGIKQAGSILNLAMGNGIAAPQGDPMQNDDISGRTFGGLSSEVKGATAVSTGLDAGDHYDFAGVAYRPITDNFESVRHGQTANNLREIVGDDFHMKMDNVQKIDDLNKRGLLAPAIADNEARLADISSGLGGSTGNLTEASTFHGFNENVYNYVKSAADGAYGAIGETLRNMSPEAGYEYFQQNMQDFRDVSARIAQIEHGLTEEQSRYFANLQTGASASQLSQARTDLINSYPAEYAERAGHIADALVAAAGAGSNAGSYLYDVKANNAYGDYKYQGGDSWVADRTGSQSTKIVEAPNSNSNSRQTEPKPAYPSLK